MKSKGEVRLFSFLMFEVIKSLVLTHFIYGFMLFYFFKWDIRNASY